MGCRESQRHGKARGGSPATPGKAREHGGLRESTGKSTKVGHTLSNTFNTQMQHEKALTAVGGHLCYRRAHKREEKSLKTIPYVYTFHRTPHDTFAQ